MKPCQLQIADLLIVHLLARTNRGGATQICFLVCLYLGMLPDGCVDRLLRPGPTAKPLHRLSVDRLEPMDQLNGAGRIQPENSFSTLPTKNSDRHLATTSDIFRRRFIKISFCSIYKHLIAHNTAPITSRRHSAPHQSKDQSLHEK